MQVDSGTLYIRYGIASNVNYPPEYDHLAALNASTGQVRWQTPINTVGGGDTLTGILDGVFYSIAWNKFDGKAFSGTVYALNASNGAQIWAMPTGATVTQWGGMVVA
jgi:outer membrane protein assembly factor BamB